MRILIPILGFGRAGGNRVISELANNLISLGHQVSILVNENSGSPYYPTAADIIWIDDDGRRVGDCRGATRSGSMNVFRNLRSLYRALVSSHVNYDVVLANHSLTAWPVQMAKSAARRFYYIQAYEPDYYNASGGLKHQVLRLLSYATYHFPLTRIVNSPVYFGYKNIRADKFVPPGIDFSKFYQGYDRIPCAKSHRPVVMGCIGRVEPEKGTKYVIAAYQECVRQQAPVALRVAFGHLPAGTEDIPGISVVMPRNDIELGEYYRSLDILIAPVTDQFGAPHYPVMEAMACGIPVITTGHLPANSQNSIVVPAHDVSAIVLAVKLLIENPDFALVKRERALKDIRQYDWATTAKQMLAYFAQ